MCCINTYIIREFLIKKYLIFKELYEYFLEYILLLYFQKNVTLFS